MSILMLSKTLSLAKQLSLRGKWISWISMLQEESRTGLFLTHKLWTRTLFQSYFQVLSGLHFHLSSRIHWTNCFELSIIEPIPVGNMGGVEVVWGVHQNAHVKEVVAGGLCVFEHSVLWVWDVGVWILSWVTWIWHWAWFFFTWVSVCYRTVVLQKSFSCMCGVWRAPCPQECPAPGLWEQILSDKSHTFRYFIFLLTMYELYFLSTHKILLHGQVVGLC